MGTEPAARSGPNSALAVTFSSARKLRSFDSSIFLNFVLAVHRSGRQPAKAPPLTGMSPMSFRHEFSSVERIRIARL
jgi:hypothetical protein